MDLQATETSYKKENNLKNNWLCPLNGRSKAVKQERKRILQEIERINTDKLNGLGIKILVKEIING